jgi:hypothetical protein
MDISRVLGHLRDIHDAPDDGRDFVAFERRPDMLAAGVKPAAFDGFDFSSKPAVAREIGVLSGGRSAWPPEPSHWRTQDLVYRGEPVGVRRGYDGTGGQMMLAAFGGGQPEPHGRPRGRGGGLMYPSRNADLIAQGEGGRIEVSPNPLASGKASLIERPQDSMVGPNERHIIDMATKYGVDPDLIRATVFMESTHGGYGGLGAAAEALGVAKSHLPMNINTNYWGDTWGKPKDLRDRRNNIEAGTRMLQAIGKVMPGASIAQRATIYNSSGKKKVTDYGARVQSIYNDKSWRKTPWPDGYPLPLGD